MVAERFTLSSAVELGRGLAARSFVHGAGRRVCDLLRLQRVLREVCVDGSSMARKAIVLDEAFSPLDRDESVHTAFGLMASLRDQHLQGLGRGGLLALRDAVSLAEPWAAELNLRRLDAELEARAPLTLRFIHKVAVAGIEVRPEAVDLVAARVTQMLAARPRAAVALAGLFVVLVPEAERRAENELLFAHLKIAARRSFDGRLWEVLRDTRPSELISIAEEPVLADTEAVQRLTRLGRMAVGARRLLRRRAPAPTSEPSIALMTSVRGPG